MNRWSRAHLIPLVLFAQTVVGTVLIVAHYS